MKVLIAGAGKLGYKLADAMNSTDVDVTLLDSNSDLLDRINDHLDVMTVNANGLEISMLKELQIEKYDLIIATTGSDETNAIICSIAKKLGCPKTIARIRNPEYIEQLDYFKQAMGIDHIVNPDLSTANEIARYLLKSYIFYSGDFAKGKVQMVDFCINNHRAFMDKKIRELEGMEGLLVAAVLRNGKIIIPDGSTQLIGDDVVYIFGRSKSIEALGDRLKINVGRKTIKRIMIIGGGNIAFYLAKELSDSNHSVTIVEQDKERCRYLSEKLSHALVIQGDGTDINLLEEENISEMDAFIGATGFDEQNILMSLMAKQAGVGKAITKISRPSYVNLINKLGIDVALNPINITASDILKYIRGGRVVSVSLLLGGQAEVIEIIVDRSVPTIGKKISEIGLPKGIIIGAVVRQGSVIIPSGKTEICADDRLVIFCLMHDVPALDIFLRSKRGN
ncbi:MAG: Trk system potassium transporter TrkA [Eubacteriales bacterium]|nr:Trk system potassium transporter TrkA [Eubacteriales bacterium]